MNRITGTEIHPLYFDEGEIGKFIQVHRCSVCRGHLLAGFAPHNRKFYAYCLECEIPSYDHNVTTIYDLEHIENEELTTKLINREKSDKTPDQLRKELGFF